MSKGLTILLGIILIGFIVLGITINTEVEQTNQERHVASEVESQPKLNERGLSDVTALVTTSEAGQATRKSKNKTVVASKPFFKQKKVTKIELPDYQLRNAIDKNETKQYSLELEQRIVASGGNPDRLIMKRSKGQLDN